MENNQIELNRGLCSACLWHGSCDNDTVQEICDDYTEFDTSESDIAFYRATIQENADEYQLFIDEMCA